MDDTHAATLLISDYSDTQDRAALYKLVNPSQRSAATRDRHADYFRLRNRADDKGFFFVCTVLYSCECSAVDAIHPTL